MAELVISFMTNFRAKLLSHTVLNTFKWTKTIMETAEGKTTLEILERRSLMKSIPAYHRCYVSSHKIPSFNRKGNEMIPQDLDHVVILW